MEWRSLVLHNKRGACWLITPVQQSTNAHTHTHTQKTGRRLRFALYAAGIRAIKITQPSQPGWIRALEPRPQLSAVTGMCRWPSRWIGRLRLAGKNQPSITTTLSRPAFPPVTRTSQALRCQRIIWHRGTVGWVRNTIMRTFFFSSSRLHNLSLQLSNSIQKAD